MTTQETKRKLTAILSADVKGYPRLIGKDEAGTLQTLSTYEEVMANLIQHHHGRVVDASGDNVLAEFASVVAYSGRPGPAIPASTYKRWSYSPVLGVFVVLNSVDSNAYIFRLTPETRFRIHQIALHHFE